jgi:hypothetical protein
MQRLLLVLAAVAAVFPFVLASAALPEKAAANAGAAFIKTQQLADGSFAIGPGQTMDAIYAVRAAGYDPAKDTVGGKSPADYLKANAGAAATTAASAAKAALGAKALGLDPKSVNDTDLIAAINAHYTAATGKFGADSFSHSIALLGLACTGNSVPAGAVIELRAEQIADGGWGFLGGSDPDTTAIALQALIAAGAAHGDAAVTKAIALLKSTQGNDGGWGFDPAESNVSSTAYVVQALIAAGENVESAAYTKAGVTPIAYLLSQQEPDGSFKGFNPAFATNQVVPALAGRTFCNAPETAITQTRPPVTPTVTPTAALPAATPTRAATAAPQPPATGNTAPATGNSGATLLVGLAVLSLAAGGVGAAAAKRARR